MDRLFTNDHHLDNFEFNFNTNNYQPSLYNNNQHYHQESPQDGSSSPSSFICLSKPSNEYAGSSDYEGSDKLIDNEPEDQNRLPKIMKRAIYKHYEPITDNGITYNHQDDPLEYKKARKRVQNRISATKIRSKNKNCVEEMKGEMDDMRQEINDLKTTNNVLNSENALLKQQITFLERLLMGGRGNTDSTPIPENIPYPVNSKIEVNTNKTKEEAPTYSRKSGSGSLRKHATYLGVMTILLCISGILTQGAVVRASFGAAEFASSKTSFNNVRLRPQTELGIIARGGNLSGFTHTSPVTNLYSFSSSIIIGLETLFIAAYVLYAIFVFTIAHRKYFRKQEESQ